MAIVRTFATHNDLLPSPRHVLINIHHYFLFFWFCPSLLIQDGASLFRAMVSEEANVFRQHFCRVLADVLYQWMSKALGKATKFSSDVQLATGTAIYDFKLILRDQRLKVIFFNALSSARKDPILMLRSFFSLCVIFVKASALACHRVLVSFSETYLDRLSFAPRKFAMGANT